MDIVGGFRLQVAPPESLDQSLRRVVCWESLDFRVVGRVLTAELTPASDTSTTKGFGRSPPSPPGVFVRV